MQRAAVGPAVNRYNMISEMCSDVLEITFCQTPCMHPAPSWGKVCFHWSARGESRSECSHFPHTDPGFLWDTWKTWAISLPAQITLLVSNYCTWGLRINYFHTRKEPSEHFLKTAALRSPHHSLHPNTAKIDTAMPSPFIPIMIIWGSGEYTIS